MSESTTDKMVRGLEAEVQEREALINGFVEAAQSEGRDLDPKETSSRESV